ncbi:MAG: multicopper oxidase domain-containing protein [Deltaproteobacteria bacterium]|nr:multicopper oxidase domain-containing protein [Deltaproteobacteria bacterium]
MNTSLLRIARPSVLAALLLAFGAFRAEAMIDGIPGPAFDLVAKADHITTGDGRSVYFWGYADGSATGMGRAQYPGPTFIVNQGDMVSVTLRNRLPVPVSLVFPGQRVTAAGGSGGLLTQEVPAYTGAFPDPSVTYTFTAAKPGTYLYHSGTRPELQVEMGLVGAIIVRPAGFDPMAPTAYGSPGSAYTHETLFVLSEMDPRVHELVETQGPAALAATDYLSDYFPNYWFMNGRNAPDTMAPAMAAWLPTQPYDCMPRMHPGERLLMRVVVAGRDLHPFHHHGNHARVIARDGRPLETLPGALDLSHEVFTIQSVPGETVDAIFQWTGEKLGWDMYGTGPDHEHSCNGISVNAPGTVASPGFDPVTGEYCPDHGKPLPVTLPQQQDLTFGGFWSGSPFLGTLSSLPPGQGGLNPNGGFTYMWHSHAEKELTNYNIFPGGMMTMLILEPPGAPIP